MRYGALERFTADDGELRVDLVIQPAISYCLVNSGMPIVRRVAATNIGSEPIAGLRLALDLVGGAGPITPPWVVTMSSPLSPASTVSWEEFDSFVPSPDLLRDNDESFDVEYRLVASCANHPTLRLVGPSPVLAHNEWFNSPALYDSLAAFAQPGSHAVGAVLRQAAGLLLNRTGSPALQGYQAGPHRAAQIAGAIYEGLRAMGLRQQPITQEFQGHAHRVRTTSAVLNKRMGTCLDLSLGYASCCQAAGLRPLIWLGPDRAFSGFLLEERHLGAPVVTETSTLMSLVDSGLAVPVEMGGIGEGVTFTAAVAAGLEHFHTTDVQGAIDVHLAHRSGIQPVTPENQHLAPEMPTSVITPLLETSDDETGGIELPPGVASTRLHQHGEDGDDAPALPDTAPPRVQRWKKSLLDLSLRNPLLNLPSTGSGTKGVDLVLPPGALAVLDDLIHDGQQVHLAPAPRATEELDDVEAVLEAMTSQRRVVTTIKARKYTTTMRALQRDAYTMQQETGGNYLYVTLGTLIHPKTTGGCASAPLFLLPVRIEGGTRGTPYALVIDGSEIAAPNHCLVEWLRVKHGVRIPQLESPARDEYGIDIPQALEAIEVGLTEHGLDYRVEESASLRLLQFPNFQIWRDLTDHWATFMMNPVVRHLVTAGGSAFEDPAGEDHEPEVAEADLHLPLSADGSQMRAVTMAERGQSFVLEGPPGTGKSQTISNLIARCLAAGRTVLFVAEKEAALDVVKDRLAGIGLAPFALNLHGRKQSMNAIRQQLLDALEQQDRSDDASWTTLETTYRSLLTPLAEYPTQVHETNAANLSVWSAYATLLASGQGPIAPIPTEYLSCPDDRRTRAEVALRGLPMAARSAGLRDNHAWSCSGRHTLSGLEADVLVGIASNLEGLRSRVAHRPGLVALLRGVQAPFDLAGMLPAIHLAARGGLTVGAPPSASARTSVTRQEPGAHYEATPDWDNSASAIESDLAVFHQTYASELRAFRADIYDRVPLDAWYEEAQDASARLFGRGRRLQAIADRLSIYLTSPAPLDPDSVEHLLARLLAIRGHESALLQRVRALGHITTLTQDWRPIQADAIVQLTQARTASVVSGKLRFEHPMVWSLLEVGVTVEDAELLEQLSGAWESWSSRLHCGEVELRRWAGDDHWFDAWQRDGAQWLEDLSGQGLAPIERWTTILVQTDALSEAGLTDFRDQLLSSVLPMPEADPAYRRGVAMAALNERLQAQGLEYFDAQTHDCRIDDLAKTAEELRAALVTRLPAMVLRRRTFDPWDCRGRVADVVAELRRKRGGKSFRELFGTYSDVILALTPCVLVSPASAATFLAPDATQFDLVVFDEASQIRVAEAIGPMGRGRATIVVGDSQQMPPTTVMRRSGGTGSDLDLWLEGTDILEELPEDLDSILSEVVEARLPQCWLSWHYRSCDESLIAFSNHHFYQDKLSSLPSCGSAGQSIGWRRVEGSFDRGKDRVNQVEAEAVVDDIVTRLTDPVTSGQSIGVVTFNIQQRDLILNLLEESTVAEVHDRMSATAPEPLFVKNLENVQGDERDVILFSLAFSTDPVTGQLPLNFGPLSQFGGERRLNVAITRARHQVTLFASFDPTDIDLSRTSAVGTRRLRQYCELAADPPRRLAELVASRDARGDRRAEDSVDLIRDEVASAVRARGYEVATALGLSDFTVDLAVRVPGTPHWQVAILLDSPSWSRRATVADRDLAPTLLTAVMGWPVVLRCWLPDWIKNREGLLDRLEQITAEIPPGPSPGAVSASGSLPGRIPHPRAEADPVSLS